MTRDLKVTRVFSTLVEEMKAIGIVAAAAGVGGGDDAQCTDVMAPVAHSERSPVLLLMGGGMGAGKSTVLKGIREEALWANAVVVEADAFKETDVIYRAISSMGHHNDMLQTAELVRAPYTLRYCASALLFSRPRQHCCCCPSLSRPPSLQHEQRNCRSISCFFHISSRYRELLVGITSGMRASSSRKLLVDSRKG